MEEEQRELREDRLRRDLGAQLLSTREGSNTGLATGKGVSAGGSSRCVQYVAVDEAKRFALFAFDEQGRPFVISRHRLGLVV